MYARAMHVFPRVTVPGEWALLQILESESDVADAAQGRESDGSSGGGRFSDFVGRVKKYLLGVLW
jgi:hypothetical protein